MVARRAGRATRPNKTIWHALWQAAPIILSITLAALSGIQAYYTFNSEVVTDIAVLKQQVSDLREAERERSRREHAERGRHDRRPDE